MQATSNGEVLLKLAERIDTQLKDPKVTGNDRTVYELLQLFVIYLIGDHAKVNTMWRTYVPMAAIFTVAAATFIGLLVSGKVEIFIR